MYSVKVRCLHTLAEIAQLRPTINALNLASTRPDPFSTFEFYETLLRHPHPTAPGRSSRVWFLAAFLNRELIGYLALEQTTDRAWWLQMSTLGLLVAHDGDRPHVVAKAEHIGVVTEMFYEYLHTHRREWDLLELQQQDEGSALYPLPSGAPRSGYWVRHWPNMDNHTITVRWRSLSEYFGALAPKFRANLKRQLRKLLACGNVELVTSADPLSTPALFELYRSVERRSWKSTTTLTIGGETARADRFRSLLGARQPMHAVIQILLLDGAPVAGLISGSFDGPAHRGLYALQMAFDADLGPAAPGSALLMMGMRHAIEGRFAFFNLLSGFGYYKARWLADATATRCAQIYRIGGLHFWHRLLGDTRRWLAARIPPPIRRVVLTGRIREEGLAMPAVRQPSLKPTFTTAERAQFAALIAAAREGKCEFRPLLDLTTELLFPGCDAARSHRALPSVQ